MRAVSYQDKQEQTIQGVMIGLLQDLQKLAPHPDSPQNRGPLFINSNPNFKLADKNDGMLGTMMMEALLGTAFSDALSDSLGSWTQEVDVSNTMECYSEYLTDIEGKVRSIAAHGQGTLARLSGKSIAGSFNLRSTISEGLQAFYEDLPKRLEIERALAYYAKQLAQVQNPAQKPDYAPMPRIAA